jgi:hypothetical protein
LTGDWKQIHNEELHDQYTSSDIIWVIQSRWVRWAGHVACIWKKEMCTGFGKPGRKGPLGRPRHGWEDYFIMDRRGVVWDKLQAVVNMVMKH